MLRSHSWRVEGWDAPEPVTVIVVVMVTTTKNAGAVLMSFVSEQRALREGFWNQEDGFWKAGIVIPCDQQRAGLQSRVYPCGTAREGLAQASAPILSFHRVSLLFQVFPRSKVTWALVEHPKGGLYPRIH